jgi:hypothetical protein
MPTTDIIALSSIGINILVFLIQSKIKADISQLRADIAERYVEKPDFRAVLQSIETRLHR